MASETRIAGKVYRAEKLPAAEAIRLYVRVGQLFANAPQLLLTLKDAKSEITPNQAFMALSMSEGADPDAMLQFIKDLVEACHVDGDAAILGVHPSDMPTAIDVAWFNLRTQFSSFLAGSLKAA